MGDWINDLERLKALREGGGITDVEFEAGKARILGLAAVPPAPALKVASESTSETPAPVEPQPEWESYDYDEEPRRRPVGMIAGIALAVLAVVGGLWWYLREPITAGRVATVAGTDLNCRAGPGMESAIKEELPLGTRLTLGKSEGGWAEATGRDCWVKEDRLVVTEPSARPVPQRAKSDAPGAGDGPETVDHEPGEVDMKTGSASALRLCSSISQQHIMITGTPDYQVSFVLSAVGEGMAANGAYWSNPRVVGSECLVHIQSQGVINGNSYSFSKDCPVSYVVVTDEYRVALGQVNPLRCR